MAACPYGGPPIRNGKRRGDQGESCTPSGDCARNLRGAIFLREGISSPTRFEHLRARFDSRRTTGGRRRRAPFFSLVMELLVGPTPRELREASGITAEGCWSSPTGALDRGWRPAHAPTYLHRESQAPRNAVRRPVDWRPVNIWIAAIHAAPCKRRKGPTGPEPAGTRALGARRGTCRPSKRSGGGRPSTAIDLVVASGGSNVFFLCPRERAALSPGAFTTHGNCSPRMRTLPRAAVLECCAACAAESRRLGWTEPWARSRSAPLPDRRACSRGARRSPSAHRNIDRGAAPLRSEAQAPAKRNRKRPDPGASPPSRRLEIRKLPRCPAARRQNWALPVAARGPRPG